MTVLARSFLLALAVSVWAAGCSAGRLSRSSSDSKSSDQNAGGIMAASRSTLAPVYAPLAEQLVSDFDLREKEGVGIDLGSGPGTLILELCRRTRMHWINADINPDVFPSFFKRTGERRLRRCTCPSLSRQLRGHDHLQGFVPFLGGQHPRLPARSMSSWKA